METKSPRHWHNEAVVAIREKQRAVWPWMEDALRDPMPSDRMTELLDRVAQRILEKLAYHEAGHAVAAHLLNYHLTRVTIAADPPPGHFGHGYVDAALTKYSPANADAVLGVAGDVAERMWCPSLAEAADRAGDTDHRSPEDDEMIRATLGEAPSAAVLATLEAEAEQLLARSWPVVEALALALLVAGELTGDDARRIMYDAAGRT